MQNIISLKKNSLVLGTLLTFVLAATFTLLVPSTSAACTLSYDQVQSFENEGKISDDISVNGNTATVRIVNNTDCSFPTTLMSWKAYSADKNSQVYFSHNSQTVAPNSVASFSISLPTSCMAQIDLYYGGRRSSPVGDGDVLLAYEWSRRGQYCSDITPDLSVTCSVSPSSVNVGNSVNWSVNANGGTGSYTYSWSGDESLSGNSSSVSKSYSSTGTKLGIVTVTSGAQSVTRTCSVSVTQQTSNLTGSCSASPSSVAVGGTINWTSNISGGTGSYTYFWSGSDNLSGNNSSVSKSYSVAGAKNASVYVTSGSQSQTFYCNANVTDTPPPTGNLNVSCDVDDSRVETDEDVRFIANATGGNGSYTYTWTGSEGMFSTNRSFEWSFDDDGTKRATVVVMSNGMTASDTCTVRVDDEDEDDNDDLRVSCYANPSNVQTGQQVRWYADVRGGDGDYDYDWDGDDGLNSSSYSPSMTYNTAGRKDATVRVRSDGQTETADCSINVNQNQVLAFSQSDVPLQGAVYLSEVPYTGLADNLKLFWFVLGLAMFSAYVAYVVIAYKNNARELN